MSLNIRGAGNKSFTNHFRGLIYSYNPDIVILMETKVNLNNAKSISASLNFPCFKIIPSEGFSGGIWLLWKDSSSFSLHITTSDKCFFHYQITDSLNNFSWFATSYGYPQYSP